MVSLYAQGAPPAAADAVALAENVCRHFNELPINAEIKFSDGSVIPVSPTAPVPTNLAADPNNPITPPAHRAK
jgi:hypothetical protein